MARDRDNLRKLIQQHGFGSIEDDLMGYARSSIRVYTTPVEDESEIPIGQSKIGGRPDLPVAMSWVQVAYGLDKRGSLPFIAQFNLKEVKPYDEENLLPESGMLYFFSDGFTGRVIFFDGNTSLLERKPFPDDLPLSNDNMAWNEVEQYIPCAVEFIPEVNLPVLDASWTEPQQYPEGKTDEDFYELVYAASYAKLPYDRPPYDRVVNRLLGYNHDIPHDLQLDCELEATHGSKFGAPDELYEQSEKTKGKWQLLFQMDSDHNADMEWNASGVICFYIRREDLKNRNFNEVCFVSFST